MRKQTAWKTFKWYAKGTAIVVLNNIVRANYQIYKKVTSKENSHIEKNNPSFSKKANQSNLQNKEELELKKSTLDSILKGKVSPSNIKSEKNIDDLNLEEAENSIRNDDEELAPPLDDFFASATYLEQEEDMPWPEDDNQEEEYEESKCNF